MKDLKRGDVVRYIGESGDCFTNNQIYEVQKEWHYVYGWEEFDIILYDDDREKHYISEDYFRNYFIKFE